MMFNKTFINTICITLMVTFLTIIVGRVTRVYALADPDPIREIVPIFDTQIVQLSDYVQDNLSSSQMDIFFLLGGAYAMLQMGAQDAKLQTPYTTEHSVQEWLINCGIQLYNSLIGLVPSGDYYVGLDTPVKGLTRDQIKALTAIYMGNAVVAKNYPDIDSFLEADETVLMPYQRDIQQSINAIWQIEGGLFDWSFDSNPFSTTLTYTEGYMGTDTLAEYSSYIQSAIPPVVRFNSGSSGFNYIARTDNNLVTFFQTYHNIFIDSSTNILYFTDDSGNKFLDYRMYFEFAYVLSDTFNIVTSDSVVTSNYFVRTVDLNQYGTYQNFLNAFFNSELPNMSVKFFYQDFVQHCYVGTTWLDKHEIFNIRDLNITDTDQPYYNEPDSENYFIDIKNLLTDLVNKTDLWDTIIHHIYLPSGVQVDDPGFIQVSIDLKPITDLLAPPLPVDLNAISEYTDNTYLDRVKENARNFGDIFVNYIFFWHNCDADIVYTFFGAGIMVLIGAFIGKWGHS